MQEMLKDRQKSILDAVIKEYIRTAKPVASKDLSRGFRLGVSPATIRNEMVELDEQGYLHQPYTSAGRVPTDKGYRFFVDNLIPEYSLSEKEIALLRKVFGTNEEQEFVREFGKVIAHMTGTFAATGLLADDTFYESGFSEILEEPEFQELESVRTFGRLVDFLDEEIKEFFKDFGGETETEKIFIGDENPWVEARPYTVMISSWKHPRGFEGFLTMIGPKRTDYPKQKAILKTIKSNQLWKKK